ncbi:MAG TPA: protein TolR [Rhodospirillaceae bacterium]|nr:protein TolR [Rhodospirillaceae bacterium]
MGASLGGGGHRRQRRGFRPMAEINVTPMVDVMLVLLVIFMITAPLLSSGVPVDLPKTNAGALKGDENTLTVVVDAKGRIFLQESEIQLEDLAPRLQRVASLKPDNRIFVKADTGINYGRVMEVMGQLNAAGFPHVALVTQPAPPPSPALRKGAP